MFINDNVFDNGLAWAVANASRIDICTQEPTTYAEATSTHSVGNKTGITLAAPSNGATDGRAVSNPEITDGSVTGDGTATHWAVTDGSGVLIATGSLASGQAVINGNTFTVAPLVVAAIRDAA